MSSYYISFIKWYYWAVLLPFDSHLMKFIKYHALGNDYLVLDPKDGSELPTEKEVRLICHRNFGLGSDGILLGPIQSAEADFGLRIFNPDGSEPEKSGNGLRIFSRYLWDCGRVKAEKDFSIMTLGGRVSARVKEGGKEITVGMGQVRFNSREIPVEGEEREVLNESIRIGGQSYSFYAATIGNPHCVIPLEAISSDLARTLGPEVETHPLFPKRINMQLLKILDRNNIQIEIWERGAGYTLASGSSSSAAAAVAYRMKACDGAITVHMPGGQIFIEIGSDYTVRMTGSVTRVAEMELDPEMKEDANSLMGF